MFNNHTIAPWDFSDISKLVPKKTSPSFVSTIHVELWPAHVHLLQYAHTLTLKIDMCHFQSNNVMLPLDFSWVM
jgi:hypothetical protein